MSDLIDRQALRAAHGLGSDCHDCKRDMKSCQYDRDYSLMDFCEWLDDAPTASPWHRVEDELPEKEGRYFIAVFYKGKWLYNVAWFVKDIGDILGVPGSDGKGGFVSNSAEVYPDCWMMPIEPPKEEEV